MGFNTGGGTSSIAGSSDVALNNPGIDSILGYDSYTSKWRNVRAIEGSYNFSMFYDTANPPDYYDDALVAAITYSNDHAVNGRVKAIDSGTGEYPLKNEHIFTEKSVVIRGGTWQLEPGASFMRVVHGLQDPIAVSNVQVIRRQVNGTYISGVATYNKTLAITIPEDDIATVKNGDLLFLTSDDHWTPPFIGASANPAYLGQWLPVSGIGVPIDLTVGNGGVPEQAVITGAISGAIATVMGSNSLLGNVSTSVIAVVGRTNGKSFKAGERIRADYGGTTVTNAGTVSAGGPYIISPNVTRDVLRGFSTNPRVHKRVSPNAVVNITGAILDVRVVDVNAPNGQTIDRDVDSVIGDTGTLRKICIELEGVANGVVEVEVKNSWGRGVQFRGCWMPFGRIRGSHLPNNANSSEGAYGYLCEVYGPTEYGDFSIWGRNMRHGFTTNVGVASSVPTGSSVIRSAGVPKYNYVHDSEITGSIEAAFDEHGGSYDTVFANCRAVFGLSGRNTTGASAFQNRGAGTRYINCEAYGYVSGWRLAANTFDYDFDHTIELRDCVVNGFQAFGYQVGASSTPVSPSHICEFVFRNTSASGDGENSATSGIASVPYAILSGQRISLNSCESKKFSGTPILFAPGGASGVVEIMNHTVDYRDGTSTGGIQFSHAPSGLVVIDNLVVMSDPAVATTPTSFFYWDQGTSTVNLKYGRLIAPMRNNNVVLHAYNTGTTASNLNALGIRELGNTQYGQSSLATPGIIAANSSYSTNVTVLGAIAGDVANVTYTAQLPLGVIPMGQVIAQDMVRCQLVNTTSSATTSISNGSFDVYVKRR